MNYHFRFNPGIYLIRYNPWKNLSEFSRRAIVQSNLQLLHPGLCGGNVADKGI